MSPRVEEYLRLHKRLEAIVGLLDALWLGFTDAERAYLNGDSLAALPADFGSDVPLDGGLKDGGKGS